MGSVDFGTLTLVGGVRVEQTDVDFSAYDVSSSTATSMARRRR